MLPDENTWVLQQGFYAVVLVQVIVTLVLVPRLIKHNLLRSLAPYFDRFAPDATAKLNALLNTAIRRYLRLTGWLATAGALIVCEAWINGVELLHWDNQAGIVVLSLLALAGLLSVGRGLQACRALSFELQKGLRTASLTARNWKSYLPAGLVSLVVMAHVLLIGSVFYLIAHPFTGFAGATNFIGLAVMDSIFVVALYRTLMRTNWPAGVPEAQKDASRSKNSYMLLMTWCLASVYLMFALWLPALDLKHFGVFTQSLYMVVLLLLGVKYFELPRAE